MTTNSKTTTDNTMPLLGPTTTGTANNLLGYKSFDIVSPEGNVTSNDFGGDECSSGDSDDLHKTSVSQTFVHLLKGYMGAGCLSLPWAISQLGFFWGPLAIFALSYWSSYNCWTIVKLKRFIERETATTLSKEDDKASESSSVTNNTQVTYAAVGEFFYGSTFETYVAICVCVQQLAVCTVFISFVGENLLAVLQSTGVTFMATHAGVMTLELPFILALALIPNLKGLSPVMAVGTGLLIISFFAIGIIIHQVWPDRPMDDPIEFNLAGAPLAVCAILYSYEGINLILPVESAMLEPQYFKFPFVVAMICVAIILSSFSIICVLAFGNVTSGSVTAFLIEAYPNDPNISWWLMVANTAVSLSVLLTYPLQLFPAIELLAPPFSRFLAQENNDEIDDDDLSAFEPLPPLPEHGFPDYDDDGDEHKYTGVDEEPEVESEMEVAGGETASVVFSAVTSIQSVLPEMTMPGDSPLLRLLLVLMTYTIAVIVPNVQSLISLAGALAGSSSALLIPPMLELAWIKHIESIATTTNTTSLDDAVATAVGASSLDWDKEEKNNRWAPPLGTEWLGVHKWWIEKSKCYLLLSMGFIIFFIGTLSSIADIVRIYLGD